MKPHIVIVLGSGRDGRLSETVAQYLLDRLQQRTDATFEFADVRDFSVSHTVPSWSDSKNETVAWCDVANRAHGFLIVSPEYNHSFPGELKMLLDMGGFDQYRNKPVLMCGVSNGIFGGARMIEHIQPVLRELRFRVIPEALYITNVKEFVPQDTAARDAAHGERIDKAVTALLSYLS